MVKRDSTRAKRDSAKREGNSSRAAALADMFRSFPGRKFTLKTLAAQSGGNDREGRMQAKTIVDQMIAEGVVERIANDKYKLATSHLPTFDGVVDMLPSGSLYVKVDGMDKDIFVDRHRTFHALNGDRVTVVILRRRSSGDPEGEILKIEERAKKNYVGVVELTRNHAFVISDSRKMPVDIFVPAVPAGVNDGDKVAVRITDWPSESKCPVGAIVDNLGRPGDNDTEMHAILAEYNLPYRFQERVIEQANSIADDLTEEEFAKRRDMRSVTTFTIDPADAKDFDDALSFARLGEGKYQIGVHIADVTHYVREGMEVETEGRERGTSVYLVDRTVPMLPERLSNELCSLRPNEVKLCFSVVFEMNDEAAVTKQWIGRTVICSDRRFAYEQAQQVIETGEGDMVDELVTLNRLAQKLRSDRFRNGAVSFEREEAKFRLDEKGKPLGVYFKEQKQANQLIEEFMLLANRTVAEFVGAKRGEDANAERTMVYRVHDRPDPDKLARFTNFILKFGYYFKAQRGKAVSKEMNRLMDEVKGKPEENIVSTLAVRTMAKAFYSTDNIGHYGLAFKYYTHFTSPIRRYPDMMVHRLLANYLSGGKSPDKQTYEDMCVYASEREVIAAEAERASIKYKMVEFMLDKIGEQFDGVVDGVSEWGVFVELKQTHIEGMVALRDMEGDYYVFDEDNYCVVGQRTKRTITLGDEVTIRVKSADLAHKLLDFEFVTDDDRR